jgi:hypothetical protein
MSQLDALHPHSLPQLEFDKTKAEMIRATQTLHQQLVQSLAQQQQQQQQSSIPASSAASTMSNQSTVVRTVRTPGRGFEVPEDLLIPPWDGTSKDVVRYLGIWRNKSQPIVPKELRSRKWKTVM